jgi:very-short-patch-repair endonuclease
VIFYPLPNLPPRGKEFQVIQMCLNILIDLFYHIIPMGYTRVIAESKHNFRASQRIKSKAKELRKQMTESEIVLWMHIRKKQLCGVHFRKQHPFGIYILDFYCFEANLVIEVDGLIHLKQLDYDLERTKDLESSGLLVLRFTNKDIQERIDWVIDEIKTSLTQNITS